MPLLATPAGINGRIRDLVQDEGPALILPTSSGPLRTDAMILLDQVFHGRPLVNWTMHPSDTNVPARYRMLAMRGQLGFLYACERNSGGDPSAGPFTDGLTLVQLGVARVYIDRRSVGNLGARGSSYLDCVERLLGVPLRSGEAYDVYDPQAIGSSNAASP